MDTELLEFIAKTLRNDDVENPITNVSFQGEGDTEVLLRYKGKSFAVYVEEF